MCTRRFSKQSYTHKSMQACGKVDRRAHKNQGTLTDKSSPATQMHMQVRRQQQKVQHTLFRDRPLQIQYMHTPSLHPLMIVTICGGKSPPSASVVSHAASSPSLFSTPLSPFLFFPLCAYLLATFSTSLLPSPSTSSPPCGRLIPHSYSFFCPKDISPPTRLRLVSLSLSLSFHLFISMSKSHPFIFLQMNRLCLWKRTEEKRSGTQRSTFSLSPVLSSGNII